MTNFARTQERTVPWLTPERLVLLLPATAGGFVAILMLLFAAPPLLLEVQQRRQAIQSLEAQQLAMPQLRRQLVEQQNQLDRKQTQQQRLLALVAGTEQLRTWITGLNDLAAASGVTVSQVEPGALEVYTPPPPPVPDAAPPAVSPAAAVPPAGSSDPLLVPGVQKRSAVITLRGQYSNILRFLQSLENLQVIAIVSEMDLKAETQGNETAPGKPVAKAPELQLKLRLAAYGRAPKQPPVATVAPRLPPAGL
jgi:hypothetical protein